MQMEKKQRAETFHKGPLEPTNDTRSNSKRRIHPEYRDEKEKQYTKARAAGQPIKLNKISTTNCSKRA